MNHQGSEIFPGLYHVCDETYVLCVRCWLEWYGGPMCLATAKRFGRQVEDAIATRHPNYELAVHAHGTVFRAVPKGGDK